jgi:hypothetical protein
MLKTSSIEIITTCQILFRKKKKKKKIWLELVSGRDELHLKMEVGWNSSLAETSSVETYYLKNLAETYYLKKFWVKLII